MTQHAQNLHAYGRATEKGGKWNQQRVDTERVISCQRKGDQHHREQGCSYNEGPSRKPDPEQEAEGNRYRLEGVSTNPSTLFPDRPAALSIFIFKDIRTAPTTWAYMSLIVPEFGSSSEGVPLRQVSLLRCQDKGQSGGVRACWRGQ